MHTSRARSFKNPVRTRHRPALGACMQRGPAIGWRATHAEMLNLQFTCEAAAEAEAGVGVGFSGGSPVDVHAAKQRSKAPAWLTTR
eukprot:991990-Pelagomonas_calceolata.AAC.3